MSLPWSLQSSCGTKTCIGNMRSQPNAGPWRAPQCGYYAQGREPEMGAYYVLIVLWTSFPSTIFPQLDLGIPDPFKGERSGGNARR
jgi:hypothetical protein